jgi:hypothetical protein
LQHREFPLFLNHHHHHPIMSADPTPVTEVKAPVVRSTQRQIEHALGLDYAISRQYCEHHKETPGDEWRVAVLDAFMTKLRPFLREFKSLHVIDAPASEEPTFANLYNVDEITSPAVQELANKLRVIG